MTHARMKWNGLVSGLAILALLALAGPAAWAEDQPAATTTTTTTSGGTTTHVERVTTGVTPIVHLIASRLEDHSQLLGALTTSSRDFH